MKQIDYLKDIGKLNPKLYADAYSAKAGHSPAKLKKLALRAVRNLALGKYPSHEERAYLLALHIPALPKNPKTAFGWVSKAAAKQDVRKYLCYVYADEDFIVATDGCRLHAIPNNGKEALPHGFYLPGEHPVEVRKDPNLVFRFPEYRKVFLDETCKAATWTMPQPRPSSVAGVDMETTIEGYTFNTRYIEEACGFFAWDNVRCSPGNGGASAQLEATNGTRAVVMSFLIKGTAR